jgi:hypothetical protein
MWSRASGNGPHAKITDLLRDLDISPQPQSCLEAERQKLASRSPASDQAPLAMTLTQTESVTITRAARALHIATQTDIAISDIVHGRLLRNQ